MKHYWRLLSPQCSVLTSACRDVAFDLGSLPLFLPGGAGHQLLTSAGLQLGSFKVPCQECGGEEGYFAMDYKVRQYNCVAWYQQRVARESTWRCTG